MPDCEEYRELISGWIDGECAADDERRLYDHLPSCSSCAPLYEAYKKISAAFDEIALDPPVELVTDVMSRIRGEKRAAKKVWRVRPGHIALAACLALVIIAAPLFLRFSAAPAGDSAPMENADGELFAASGIPDAVPAPSDAKSELPFPDIGDLEPAPAEEPSDPMDELRAYMPEYFVIITLRGPLPDFLYAYPAEDMGDGSLQIVVPREEISPLTDGSYSIVTGNEQAPDALVIYIP